MRHCSPLQQWLLRKFRSRNGAKKQLEEKLMSDDSSGDDSVREETYETSVFPLKTKQESRSTWLQRFAVVSWSQELCRFKKLPIQCFEIQMELFIKIQISFPNLDLFSDICQTVLLAALCEAGKRNQFNLSLSDLTRKSTVDSETLALSMIKEMSGMDLIVGEFSNRAKKLTKKLLEIEQACFEFLSILRWTLPQVFKLPIRLQLIVCLATTEWVCDGRLIVSWELICNLITKSGFGGMDQAETRIAIRVFIECLTQLPWGQHPWLDNFFEREFHGFSSTQQLGTLLRNIKPINHCHTHEPSILWLCSPSILE